MFRDHITPERTANSITLESGDNFFLLVEGENDIPIYKKLMSSQVKIKVSFGKAKMKEIDKLLKERNFENYIGIRDADFLRLKNNPKYDPEYNGILFASDEHDSEGMIVVSSALEEFFDFITNEKTYDEFKRKHGSIRELCYKLCYPIACLRLANKRYNLGLAFKPAKPEGNKLKYKKFICEKTFVYLGHEKLINTIHEYSTNRGGDIKKREQILRHLDDVIKEEHNIYDIVNGHDLVEALYIICKKGLKSQNQLLNDASCVEEMLRLAFNLDHFKKTHIYKCLDSHQRKLKKEILRQ